MHKVRKYTTNCHTYVDVFTVHCVPTNDATFEITYSNKTSCTWMPLSTQLLLFNRHKCSKFLQNKHTETKMSQIQFASYKCTMTQIASLTFCACAAVDREMFGLPPQIDVSLGRRKLYNPS